jgi:hypothetical protein
MSSTTTKPEVDTAAVRAWFQADKKRIEALPEADQHKVREGARGRLPKSAVNLHNKRRRVTYTEGLTGQQARADKAARQALRAELIAQGLAGKRGPVPAKVKEALDALAAAKA